MRRIVTAITAATLALGLVAQAVPAAAVTGYDSAYAGESAFLTLNPGQSGTFTVFFANTGTTTWTKGTATQVDLLACLEDKVTCDQQDAREAPFNSGWLSATRYATTTQTSVAPGQIGTFTYNVAVPTGASGLYRFNGDVAVASLGAAGRIHPEGYFQDVNVPGPTPPPTGAITVTPADKATNIVSTALGTVNASRGSRTYTVALGTGVTAPVRIQLFAADNVIINSDGTLSFLDTDGNRKADGPNCTVGGSTNSNCSRWLIGATGAPGVNAQTVQAYIESVNGVPTGNTTGTTSSIEASPASGSSTITFVVNSQEMDQVIPIVWKDANNDGLLDVDTKPCCGAADTDIAARQANGVGNPTETVTSGGQKNWTPENAAFASFSCTAAGDADGRVVFVDKTLDYAVVRHNGVLRRFNWDTNDTFAYVSTITQGADGPGLTQAQFESFLSPTAQTTASAATATGEDRLQIAYNPDAAAASKLTYCADRPTRPASITVAVTDAPDTIPQSSGECRTSTSAAPCTLDAGATLADTDTDADDVSITFPLSVNPCVTSYTVQRRTTTDNGINFSTSETVTVNARLKNSTDTTITVYDLNVPVGLHAWRVAANANDPQVATDIAAGGVVGGEGDPECGIGSSNSSNRTSSTLTITTQPGGGGAVSGRPISVDARMTTNATLASTLDTLDVFKVTFNETMSANTTSGASIFVRDADGTVGKILCTNNSTTAPNAGGASFAQELTASCEYNQAAGSAPDGSAVGIRQVLTVTILQTGTPAGGTGVPTGTTPGVQIPATIFDASGIVDTTGDTWDIAKSTDVVIDNE